ncbi:MAG: hypothetical protein B6U87_00155 [Candidatus Aenigmarchaeota archaeon ex4484_52]|nr:MAG: hypothetical protein B6U87_00155 [Candidatus Aenigmarchaeota archaeon ex4484_52]
MDNTIEKLKKITNELRDQRQKLNDETKKFLEKNKKDFAEINLIKSKIRIIQEKNNECVNKIKELKKDRNALNSRILELNKEIGKIKGEKTNDIYKNNNSDSILDLKNKISKLEWFIQTKPISLKKEEELQDKLTQMKKTLEIKKQFSKNIRKSKRLKIKKTRIKNEADEKHKQLVQFSLKSDEYFSILTNLKKKKKLEEKKIDILINELNILKKNANDMHQKYINAVKILKEKMKKIKIQTQKETIEKNQEQSKKVYDLFLKGKKLSLSDLALIKDKIDESPKRDSNA